MARRDTPRCIVLTGPPAAGKSTAGRLVAHELGRPFADLDACIEAETGSTVATLFTRAGERAFREHERRVFERLLAQRDGTVIAAGGGALLDRALRHRVLREAWVVALDAPLEVLVGRVSHAPAARPLLAGSARASLEALIAQRADVYAECHAAVSSARDPALVAQAIVAAVRGLVRARTCVVPLGERTYRVEFSRVESLVARTAALAPSARVLVTDARVARLPRVAKQLGAMSPAASVRVPGVGDGAKNVENLQRIWAAALGAGIDRDALVVAVGGGVVTDLAGFAAATLLRGVRYATAPTTLLAMADASVGGKTGIDFGPGKNLVGAFHQPALVVVDQTLLETLPPRRVREGMAEIVKIALTSDAELFAWLEAHARELYRPRSAALAVALRRAVQAKIDVVVRDEREGSVRAVLNFGHTLGHAIEYGSDFAMAHGECVALGIRGALRLGVRMGITPPALAARGEALLDALGLPRRVGRRVDARSALAALQRDKKRRGSDLRFVFCDAEGSAALAAVPLALAEGALRALMEIR